MQMRIHKHAGEYISASAGQFLEAPGGVGGGGGGGETET